MAIRQKSDSKSGRTKKPRVQAILPEPLLAQLEAYAEAEGMNTSEAVREIIRGFFNDRAQNPSSRPTGNYSLSKPSVEEDETEKMAKLLKLMQLAKQAELI